MLMVKAGAAGWLNCCICRALTVLPVWTDAGVDDGLF